jgi:hypothetical protein
MAYALRTDAGPIELAPGQNVTAGEITFSYDTLLAWSDKAKADLGILPVVEPGAIPAGKTVTGSTLTDDGTAIRRVWTLADAPPFVEPVPQDISDRQFFQALALRGLISNEEALAAVKTGEIPSAMSSFITVLPADEQFSAQMLLCGATVFERSNALVPAFMAAQTPPMTSADIDALWTFAATL